jgi:hypothetical protein
MTIIAKKIIGTAFQILGEDPALIAEAKEGYRIKVDEEMNITYVREVDCILGRI